MIENSTNHEMSILNQFINDNFEELCLDSGLVRYENEEVKCSVHKSKDDEDGEPGKKVPWL